MALKLFVQVQVKWYKKISNLFCERQSIDCYQLKRIKNNAKLQNGSAKGLTLNPEKKKENQNKPLENAHMLKITNT